MTDPLPSIDTVIQATRRWVQNIVVDMQLCPFAQRELDNNRVRFEVSDAKDGLHLLQALQDEIEKLEAEPEIETTLLIHPQAMTDFERYNQFLDRVDDVLEDRGWVGFFQVASFHPQYQFADTQPDDAENFTNRSPFPMLHILREESLEKAIEAYPEVDAVPERNIARMNALGAEKLRAMLRVCLEPAQH